MNLILLEPGEADASGRLTLSDARARHILQVLRGRPGQNVRLGIVDGALGVGVITSISEEAVTLECGFEPAAPARPRVDLLLALPRPKVLRRLWAQLAALGVDRILITNAARVERQYFDTHVLDPATYRGLLLEGLQQARDTRMPRVSVHRRFKVLVEDELDVICPQKTRVVADAAGAGTVRAAVPYDAPRVLLAIGPEGGWNAFELELLASRGFSAVSLGPRTLRTDTACIAMLTLVHDAIRGLGGPESPPLR